MNGQRHDRNALIAYGSETGTAQDIAEELERLVKRLRFRTRLCALNDVSLNDLLTADVVLIAISTTGQGDLPANSRNLWKRLRSTRLQTDCLDSVRFASFGLGDSSYPQFNWAHRKLHSRLLQLGARPICERGEADEQHPEGVDGLFAPWTTRLRDALLHRYPLLDGQSSIPDDVFLTPEWKLEPKPQTNGHQSARHAVRDQPLSDLGSWTSMTIVPEGISATLIGAQRMTPNNHWQDIRLFDFSLPSSVSYRPGDVLTIHPKNFPADVDELMTLQDWQFLADCPLHQVSAENAASFDSLSSDVFERYPQVTVRMLLTHILDITAIPRRSFFASIAHFARDRTQQERLVEFTKPEYLDEFYDYTTRPRRSILEVLQEFDSVKIPLQWICSIFPRIRGRQFSIASGGTLKHGSDGSVRVQLLVAIVKYRTVIKKVREGLCTRYLAALEPGAKLNVQLVKAGMNVDLIKPAIMIGPGTGVAPLRSLIHERHTLEGQAAAEMLFFGARNRAADYFFEHEWKEISANADLQVLTAFSRDQRDKRYVQDVIREHSRDVDALLQKEGVIYVCGSSGQMPKSVRAALVWVLEQEQGLNLDQARAHLETLEKQGRYQQETW